MSGFLALLILEFFMVVVIKIKIKTGPNESRFAIIRHNHKGILMNQETFIVGNKEFTCVRMNAFVANKLLMRIQKIAVPVLGSLLGKGKAIGDIDVKEAARIVAENLDEKIIDEVVLPMFLECRLYATENKKFIKSEAEINQCFTTENLFDFYELIFLVGRYQFGPFFASLASRFGSLTNVPEA